MAKKRYRRGGTFRYADFGDDMMGFGGGGFGAGLGSDHIAGPLVGGGAANMGLLATKLIWKDNPKVTKWAGLIGTLVGAATSGALMFSPRFRGMGVSGLITAALIGVPRQIEDMLTAPATMKDYLGIITPEREMAGYLGEDQQMQQDVQLLDSGSGSTGVLGVITPEREMAGGAGPLGQGGDVELLGAAFGSNFLAQG